MNEKDRSATSGAAPVSEFSDRAEPQLVTQYGDLLDMSATLEKSRDLSHRAEYVRVAAQATEPQPDAKRMRVTAEPDATIETNEQAQRMRRVEEFARERHPVEAWGGGEHSGTVVAAAASGIVVHVGRNEYISVPAQRNEPFVTELLGRHVSVTRGGEVVETARGIERAAR